MVDNNTLEVYETRFEFDRPGNRKAVVIATIYPQIEEGYFTFIPEHTILSLDEEDYILENLRFSLEKHMGFWGT